MGDFRVETVRVGTIEKHPNADSLGIVQVFGYPVIVRLGDFAPGDIALYVPVDAVVPVEGPFAFLDNPAHPGRPARVKAKRLRGVFSMGLLAEAPACAVREGEDFAERLGIVKYEEPEPILTAGENAPAPGGLPAPVPYYDIESFRRWPDVLEIGEDVEVTEKLHGANARFLVRDGVLHVGSHGRWKLPDGGTVWARAARQHGLAEKLAQYPDVVFFGEVFGQVQDLKYGARRGELFLRFFDLWHGVGGQWADRATRLAILGELGLDAVPELYRGPWSRDLLAFADGRSTVPGADNIREGIVVKPIVGRTCDEIGRVILKHVGESYLLRKGGTERH